MLYRSKVSLWPWPPQPGVALWPPFLSQMGPGPPLRAAFPCSALEPHSRRTLGWVQMGWDCCSHRSSDLNKISHICPWGPAGRTGPAMGERSSAGMCWRRLDRGNPAPSWEQPCSPGQSGCQQLERGFNFRQKGPQNHRVSKVGPRLNRCFIVTIDNDEINEENEYECWLGSGACGPKFGLQEGSPKLQGLQLEREKEMQ